MKQMLGLFWIVLLLSGGNRLFSLTARDILSRCDAARAPGTEFEMKLRLTTYRDQIKQNEIFMKGFVRGGEESMIKFTGPANMKGRKILMKGNEMWIIFPNTRRPIRVTPAQRLIGDISNGDVARVNFSSDYSPTLIGQTNRNERTCYLLQLLAKTPAATYGKIDLWVDTSTFAPIFARYYSRGKKLLKTVTFSAFKKVGSYERPTKLNIKDEINKKSHSELLYLLMQQKKVPAKYFNKEYLLRM